MLLRLFKPLQVGLQAGSRLRPGVSLWSRTLPGSAPVHILADPEVSMFQWQHDFIQSRSFTTWQGQRTNWERPWMRAEVPILALSKMYLSPRMCFLLKFTVCDCCHIWYVQLLTCICHAVNLATWQVLETPLPLSSATQSAAPSVCGWALCLSNFQRNLQIWAAWIHFWWQSVIHFFFWVTRSFEPRFNLELSDPR